MPMRQAFVPMIWVAGVAYGLLSLEVTSSSRSLRFFLGTSLRSSLSESSGILALLRSFGGFESVEWDDFKERVMLVGDREEITVCTEGRERVSVEEDPLNSMWFVPVHGSLRSISTRSSTRHDKRAELDFCKEK